jgi:trk system potassium uptake protein TrkA
VSESYESPESSGLRGDPTDVLALEAAGVADASTVVVATRSDRRNLLIAQLVRTRFDVPRVVVLVNVPERLEPLAEAGHEPVCVTSALADVLTESV